MRMNEVTTRLRECVNARMTHWTSGRQLPWNDTFARSHSETRGRLRLIWWSLPTMMRWNEKKVRQDGRERIAGVAQVHDIDNSRKSHQFECYPSITLLLELLHLTLRPHPHRPQHRNTSTTDCSSRSQHDLDFLKYSISFVSISSHFVIFVW